MEQSIRPQDSNPSAYRPDIDGLRAVAIGAVLFFHASPAHFPAGFIGVDIFFAISGYLITGIIWRELQERRFSLSRFYGHRVRRIFPSLIIVLLATWLLGGVTLLQSEYESLGSHITYASTFFLNFKLWFESGYFNTSAESKPLLNLWSLSVEEQFYLLWPAVLVLAVNRSFKVARTVGIIALGSFLLNLFTVEIKPEATFYLPFTRLWELLAGALIAVYPLKISSARRELLSIFGFGLLGLAFLEITPLTSFPGIWALAPILGTVFIISSGPDSRLNHVLAHPLLVWVGKISYPLYLWHWPLLSLSRVVVGKEPPLLLRLSVILLSFVLAWITYRWIEIPVRARIPIADLRQRKILTLIGILGLVSLLGITTVALDGFPKRISGIPMDKTSRGLHRKKMIDKACPLKSSKASMPLWCRSSGPEPAKYALVGDSHAQALFPSLVRASENKDSWLVIANPGCAPFTRVGGPTEANECDSIMNDAVSTLAEIPSVQWVVFSFFSLISPARGPGGEMKYVVERFEKNIEKLEHSGKRVLFLVDNPQITNTPERCDRARPIERLGVRSHTECVISREQHEKNLSELRTLISHLEKRFPSLLTFDPTDILCETSGCAVNKDNHSLYDYTEHLSSYGGELISPGILEKIRSGSR